MRTNGDWERVRELFHAALDRPASTREEFVRSACDGDERLRGEVLSLLRAHVEAAGFLESPAHCLAQRIAADPAPTLESGDRVGNFRVIGPLASGGMGEVYRAHDPRLRRDVALKVLPPALAANRQRLARFERESRILASLNHPNIASIYSVEQVEVLRLLVLELVEGPTLADRLKSGPMTVADSLAVARQLAAALQAAHERDIVHRDLKPANVKLSHAGVVKLLDFGIATEGGWPGETNIADEPKTLHGLILGTCGYMSPEQARGEPVDTRADVWAFGCILFELLTGRRAFAGDTAADTLAAVLERQPNWTLLPAATPPGICALLRQCLEKDRDRRLRSVPVNLDSFAAPEPDTRPVGAHSGARGRSSPDERGHWWALARASLSARALLAVVTLLAVAALTAAAWMSAGATRPRHADSLVILPFVSTAGDPELEYVGEGLAETLINDLSGLDGLRIVPRTTAFRLGGSAGDPVQAAKQLNVRTVLAGKVTHHGDHIVVQADLIDATRNAQLWGARLQAPLGDLLTVQREIARGIKSSLRLPLRSADATGVQRPPTRDGEAYRLYLKGLYHWNKDTRQGYDAALELFSAALERDHGFALAHVGVGMVHHNRVSSLGMAPPGEAMPLALAAANHALKLDDRLAEAYLLRGIIRLNFEWDVAASERDLRQALALNPNLALAHSTYGVWLFTQRRIDESVAAFEHAVELDPLSLRVNTGLALIYHAAGRTSEALMQFDATNALDRHPGAYFFRVTVLHAAGRFDEALDGWLQFRRLLGDEAGAALYERAATRDGYRAMWLVHRDRLLERSPTSYVSPMLVAYAAALGGDAESAFEYLERAYESRAADMAQLHVNTRLADLRSDVRFLDLVRRVGIDPAVRR